MHGQHMYEKLYTQPKCDSYITPAKTAIMNMIQATASYVDGEGRLRYVAEQMSQEGTWTAYFHLANIPEIFRSLTGPELAKNLQ